MQTKRLSFWVTLTLIGVFLLAGCAPRAGGGENLAMAGSDDLVVDLPALVIDFNSEGEPSVGNVPLAQLADTFAPGTLDAAVLPPDIVTYMVDSNIQHLQIDNSPTGLIVLVNGEPIPSLRWDGEILGATAGTLAQLGVGIEALDKLLPLVTHLGLGVIVRFPVPEGVAAIPTHIEGAGPAAMAAQERQDEFLTQVGTPPTIKVPVIYSADGSWRVGDLTDEEWEILTGNPMWRALRLQPNMIEGLIEAGITEAALSTDADGIHISINGRPLPYVGWADGELNHVLDLAGQMGLWDTLADSGMNMSEVVGMVQNLLPVVQASEASINVYFPKSLAASS